MIKGDVIFIPNFNLLDFHMNNKISPMTCIDLETAELKKISLGFASYKQRT